MEMTNNNLEIAKQNTRSGSVLTDMSNRYGMDPKRFKDVVMATCMPASRNNQPPNEAEFAAFLMVARDYNLNPITKQIYAFPTKSGGIQPMVSVDGWAYIINTHAACDGIEFTNHTDEKGNVDAITCRIYRKGWGRPISVTEYMTECKRSTDSWNKSPRRMLRHRALIQCGRIAFGLSGISDEEDYIEVDYIEQQIQVMPQRTDYEKNDVVIQKNVNDSTPSYMLDELDENNNSDTSEDDLPASAAGQDDAGRGLPASSEIMEKIISLINKCNSIENVKNTFINNKSIIDKLDTVQRGTIEVACKSKVDSFINPE
jgi:phage recombination protein Bet